MLYDPGGEKQASSSAPTVAAVPVSKRRDTRESRWRTIAAFVALLGVASLVPVLIVGVGTWSDEVMPNMTQGPPEASSAEPPGELVADEPPSELPEAGDEALDEVFSLEEEEVAAAEAEAEAAEAQAAAQAAATAANPEVMAAEERPPTAEDPSQNAAGLDEAKSPWRTRRGVTLLTNLHRRLVRGESLSSASERALKRYVRSHRDDPRPHLLLAMGYFTRGWGGAAVQRYGLALRVDGESRHDPRMLRDVVRVVEFESDSAEAAVDFVARVFGGLAAPEVEARLSGDTLSGSARLRLQTLLDRVRSDRR